MTYKNTIFVFLMDKFTPCVVTTWVMCGLLVVWTPAVVEEVAACHVVAMTTCHVIAMATCLFLTYVRVECRVHALRTRGISS